MRIKATPLAIMANALIIGCDGVKKSSTLEKGVNSSLQISIWMRRRSKGSFVRSYGLQNWRNALWIGNNRVFLRC